MSFFLKGLSAGCSLRFWARWQCMKSGSRLLSRRPERFLVVSIWVARSSYGAEDGRTLGRRLLFQEHTTSSGLNITKSKKRSDMREGIECRTNEAIYFTSSVMLNPKFKGLFFLPICQWIQMKLYSFIFNLIFISVWEAYPCHISLVFVRRLHWEVGFILDT